MCRGLLSIRIKAANERWLRKVDDNVKRVSERSKIYTQKLMDDSNKLLQRTKHR